MSENSYEIVFRGKLVAGHDEAQVKANMGKLFKAGPETIDKLFAGGRVVLKKNLDRDTAYKYRDILKKAGAVTVVSSTDFALDGNQSHQKPATVNPPSPATTQNKEAPAPSPAQSASGQDDSLPLDEPGVQLVEKEVIPEPEFDLSSYSVAEAGVQMDEHKRVDEPLIDISDLEFASDEGPVDNTPKAAEPDIDISSISISEDEGPVDNSPKPETPDFDLGELSLEE